MRTLARFLIVAALLFCASPAHAWWNNSWALRRKITFNNSGQITNLVDFPVLIRLDASRVEYFRTQNLGQDIRFVDSNDVTLLDHEIELWNEAGSSYLWVRIPQVNGASTTDFIYMYYDNPAAPPLTPAQQEATWDAGFKLVQHLEETSGTHLDSTSNGNDSVDIDVATQGSAAGQIDGADDFAGAHNVDVADSASLDMGATDSFTVEAWVNTSAGGFQVVVSKEEDLASEYQLWVDSGFATFWLRDGTDSALAGGTPVANGFWHYLVGRWDEASSTAEIFVDGVSVGSATNPALDAMSSPTPLVIGEEGDLNRLGNFDGQIDEVRVSKVARSNDWIQAQHLSMTDAFATFAPADAFACCQPLAVAVASGTITVTAANAFEQVFADAAGGHVREFYDLAESPVRDAVHDLAGGINNQDGLFLDELRSTVDTFNYRLDKDPNLSPARASLLEATATRVLVRSVSPFARPNGAGLVLGGVKGVGDWSVYPSGRMALHWKRMTTNAVDTDHQQLHLNVHHQPAAPLNGWTGFTESGPICFTACSGPASDDFVLMQNEQPGGRTDFLTILDQDWANATETYADVNPAQEWVENSWFRPSLFLTIPAGTTETWNFLTYFKPTIFTSDTDPAVTERNADYQTPDNLALPALPVAGTGWFDPSESTVSPSDFFNEKEAAYALDFDPVSGLNFDMDGGTTTRYHPFLKIRQWRSLSPPSTITLEGVTLTRDVDFRADLMPVSRASMHQDLLWYSTLQNAGAVTSPDVGSAGSIVGGVSFTPARYGSGAVVSASGDWIAVPTAGNFDRALGRIAFWYRPTYDSNDGVDHDIWGFVDGSGDLFVLEKRADNNLYFRINTASGLLAGNSELQVASANFTWRANEWVHLRVSWDDTLPLGTQQRIHVNDVEPINVNPTVLYDATLLSVASELRFGNSDGNATFAPGVYDELDIVRDSTAMANGGLVPNPTEFLADPANNLTLDFTGLDPDERGRYWFPAATAKFRGLNIALAAAGAGVAPGALQWEYWDGTGWASLEAVAGFTDQTNSLTRDGTVFWTAEPSGWVPYSLSGGIDLYRLRVHLPAGSYTTLPVEGLIKTDVLFLQYCGEITLDAQTFGIAPPIPTAVELGAFEARGLDGALELTWETVSELKNLGFHLYRSMEESGSYERITASAIPGLGSSPHGARYRYLDSGLSNGTTYFYQLEDIETTGKTKRHGPISAVPKPADGNEGATPPGSSTGASNGEIVYGDPSAVSFRELERTADGVLLELRTEGFTAQIEEGGAVRLSIPGFSEESAPGTPAIPVKRSWVEVYAGRGVRVASVRAEAVEVLSSLTPVAGGTPELVASRRGTVRGSRRRTLEGREFRGAGLYPDEVARLLEMGYQGESKKALMEISPLRWD